MVFITLSHRQTSIYYLCLSHAYKNTRTVYKIPFRFNQNIRLKTNISVKTLSIIKNKISNPQEIIYRSKCLLFNYINIKNETI